MSPLWVVVALVQLSFLMGWAALAGTVVLIVTLQINIRSAVAQPARGSRACGARI